MSSAGASGAFYAPQGTKRRRGRHEKPPAARSGEAAPGRRNGDDDSPQFLPVEGESGPEAGRSYRRLRLPGHRATSDVVAGAYPFLAEAGLGSEGVYIGQDAWSGGGFCFDPWILYRNGVLTNPNCLLAGVVGKGKSCLAKSIATRSIAVGRRVYIPSDPKGEWSVVAHAVGGAAIQLGTGSAQRLNPLDPGTRITTLTDPQWIHEVTRRRRTLLGSLAESALGRPLAPVEHTALDAALADSTGRNPNPTLPLDLSRVHGSDQLVAMVMTCASAWMEAALTHDDGSQRWVIYDEAWRLMRQPALLARMQSQWKLSRALGIANLLIVHRLSDLDAVGDRGSEARALARGLLGDCSTKIIYQQEVSESPHTAKELGLSSAEHSQLPELQKGEGLWRVGQRSFVVRHIATDNELRLFDTNARMSIDQ